MTEAEKLTTSSISAHASSLIHIFDHKLEYKESLSFYFDREQFYFLVLLPIFLYLFIVSEHPDVSELTGGDSDHLCRLWRLLIND